MPTLAMIRHGQSEWNLANRFTGWTDVGLTEQGVAEAQKAGQLLLADGHVFQRTYTSVLKRAIKTLWLALEEMDAMWLPQITAWQLNERHYGALQGLNKAETAQKHSPEQVHIWRRSYDTPPPGARRRRCAPPAPRPALRRRRSGFVAGTESLKTTLERVLPYWRAEIAPVLEAGEKHYRRRPRQQPARPRQASFGDQRRSHSRPRNSDRQPVGFRTRCRSGGQRRRLSRRVARRRNSRALTLRVGARKRAVEEFETVLAPE